MKRAVHKARVVPSEQLLLAFDSQHSMFTINDALPAGVRRIAVGNEIIGYRLHRVRRRSIGFQINENGLTIRAPRWITLRDIETAIVENKRWIRTKQVEWHDWREQQRLTAILFADGGKVQYLGRAATLRLAAGVDATCFDGDADEIRLALSSEAAEVEVRQTLQAWLQEQARRIFTERIERFADRIDACPSSLQAGARFAGWRLSSARTQWGSCSHDGRIRLNWRLMHFPLPVIDYVIAHELAHLRELNHSARFWNTVAQLLPGFEAARAHIKRVDIGAISF